jgi:hypothetical protein
MLSNGEHKLAIRHKTGLCAPAHEKVRISLPMTPGRGLTAARRDDPRAFLPTFG